MKKLYMIVILLLMSGMLGAMEEKIATIKQKVITRLDSIDPQMKRIMMAKASGSEELAKLRSDGNFRQSLNDNVREVINLVRNINGLLASITGKDPNVKLTKDQSDKLLELRDKLVVAHMKTLTLDVETIRTGITAQIGGNLYMGN